MSDFRRLVDEAMGNEEFAASLVDPLRRVQALSNLGIEPTPELLAALEGAYAAVQRLADAMGDDFRMAPI